MCVGTHWNAKSTAKPKIGDLNGPFVVNEQVLRLQVAMNHPAHVHEHNTLENLVRVALRRTIMLETGSKFVVWANLDQHGIHSLGVYILLEIHLHELKHQVELHILVHYAFQPSQ